MLYLILLLPLALAALSLIRNDRARTVILATGQVLLLALLIGACTLGDMATPVWHMTADLTFSLRLDGLGRFFCLLTAVCWLLTIPYASVYMTHEGHHPRFYAFLMLTEAAVLGAALAADLVTLYLFYELTTLLSFPLVLHTQRPKALLGAVKYLYYSVCGGFIALFGVVLLAQQSSLTFVRGGYFQTLSPTLLAASFLMLLGFGAKAGLYPLHNWLPSAHPVAPAPAHALLSGIIAKVGAIAAIRVIYFTVGAEALRGTWVQTVCIVLTLVTIFMGSFMGCTENGLKKRLAYSSISQISYVLLGVFLMTPVGLLGGLLQLLFHALAKIGVFQSAGSIIFLTETETIDGFPGLGRRIPVTMGCFAALALSLVGIPPFGGFFSKWYLALGALDGMSAPLCYIIPAVLLISALLTAAYLFPPLCRAFFPGQDFPARSRVREPPRHRHYHLFRDGSGDSGGHRIHPGALCGVSADPGISEIQSPPLPEGPVTNRKSAGKGFTSSQQRFPLRNRRDCGRRTAEEQTHFFRIALSRDLSAPASIQ